MFKQDYTNYKSKQQHKFSFYWKYFPISGLVSIKENKRCLGGKALDLSQNFLKSNQMFGRKSTATVWLYHDKESN